MVDVDGGTEIMPVLVLEFLDLILFCEGREKLAIASAKQFHGQTFLASLPSGHVEQSSPHNQLNSIISPLISLLILISIDLVYVIFILSRSEVRSSS